MNGPFCCEKNAIKLDSSAILASKQQHPLCAHSRWTHKVPRIDRVSRLAKPDADVSGRHTRSSMDDTLCGSPASKSAVDSHLLGLYEFIINFFPTESTLVLAVKVIAIMQGWMGSGRAYTEELTPYEERVAWNRWVIQPGHRKSHLIM